MNSHQASSGGHSTLRADLAQAVEAKMATMKKDQFQTMTFPMLVSFWGFAEPARCGPGKK